MAGRYNDSGRYRRRRRRIRPMAVLLWMLLTVVCIGIGIFIAYGLTFIWNEKPVLALNGPQEMTVEMPEVFEDPGATAKLTREDLSGLLQTEGQVDSTVSGDYTIVYKLVNYRHKDYEISRVVHVVDTTPPEIELYDGNTDIVVSSMNNYEEPGFAAQDAVDGDLTSAVQTETETVNASTVRIIYTVTDAHGNAAEAERWVTIDDTDPPVITLLGASSMSVDKDSFFTDPGVSAVDEADGDLTDSVQTEGEVDTSRQGAYTIVYSVTDSSGNEAKITRTVVVGAGAELDPDGSYVYMTFDDGPGYHVTERILDILKANNIKATFFIVNYPEDRIPLLKRMAEEGHTIGIHTWDHDYSVCYGSKDAYYEGVEKLKEKLQNDIGYSAYCIRFPGGSSNTVSKKYTPGVMTYLVEKMHEEGYKYYDWNVDSTDAEGNNRPAETLIENVTSGLKHGRGNVVLCHDIDTKSTTADALQSIIDYGLENGYTFLPILPDTPEVHHSVNN